MKLQVEYIPLNEIKLYPNNAKIHTAEQIEQIKKSIKEFGFNDPIGIWHGECVEGHGRIIAATELGLETVPVIRLDELTDEQRRAYMLVHNKLTMNTNFDFGILEIELDGVDIDMTRYGFDDIHLDSFFSDEEHEPKEKQEEKTEWRVLAVCDEREKRDALLIYLDENGIKHEEL